MEKVLTEIDSYTVQSQAVLGNEDRNIITKLYQPLIGCGAAMLYFSLWAELERNKNLSLNSTHKRICSLMGITIYVFEDYRRKLEGIGLLKTYTKQKDVLDFIYELQAPLSPKAFFKNPLLAGELLKAMGQLGYEKTMYFFSAPSVDTAYKNISKTYDDVFVSSRVKVETNENIREKKATGPVLSFDFTHFASLLSDVSVPVEVLNDESKEFISGLATVYNLDMLEMRTIVAKSVNKDKVPVILDFEILSKNARVHYNNKTTAQKLEEVYKATPKSQVSKSTPSTTLEIKIKDMETLSPYEYLKNLQGSDPVSSDLTIIESIMLNQKITPAVTNAIVDYATAKNEGRLIKEFAEKLAASLKRAKIVKAKDAMLKLTSEKTKKSNKENVLPQWYNASSSEVVGSDEEEVNMLSEKLKKL